jgi:alpha-ketoglutarate-dependent taurine dioxygenase
MAETLEQLVSSAQQALASCACELHPLDPGRPLPLVIEPRAATSIQALGPAAIAELDRLLPRAGALLLRGFRLEDPGEFGTFARSFGRPLMAYEFGSTPRREVTQGVYSSTEYPPKRTILLHNEQSYTCRWPSRIWFHCVTAAESGGDTPIADSRAVFNSIPEPIREEFIRKGLLYVRNYGLALDVPWQRVFGTEDRAEVQRFCAGRGIECSFDADGRLRTRERCQAAIEHPVHGEWVWFNQAHLFHVAGLEPQARQSLSDFVPVEDLPRHVYFGDGSPILDSTIDEILDAYRRHAIAFRWQSGDVLMLDNLTVAHGRTSFTGPRTVHVAMA